MSGGTYHNCINVLLLSQKRSDSEEEEEDYHSTDWWSRVRYVEDILLTIAKFTPQVHAIRYKTVLNIMMEHHAASVRNGLPPIP